MNTTKDLDGNKFIELGQKFKDIHVANKLTARNLFFSEANVCKYEEGDSSGRTGEVESWKEGCGTVACHGGWGSVIFGLKETHRGVYASYDEGADAIANFLGFEAEPDFFLQYEVMSVWADHNPDLWGNEDGCLMFDSNGYRAFGLPAGRENECTLHIIGEHYITVGKRLLEANA